MMTIPIDPPPALTREEAVAMGEAELDAMLEMLHALDDEHWRSTTDCSPWTVRDLVAHLAGAAEEAVRLRVQVRHMLRARTRDRHLLLVDSLNAQQLEDRADATPVQLLEELASLGARAPKARAKVPALIRRNALPAGSGAMPGDTLGYLLDVIYTRDMWMHRIDLARATGCPMPYSGVEAALVAQIVRDVERAWSGPAFVLDLTGRVEGSWSIGHDPAGRLRVDTVDACRLWSGRSDETQPVPDGVDAEVADRFRELRILF